MSYFWDKYERFTRGNEGTSKTWYEKYEYDFALCTTTVRDDGKILDRITCVESDNGYLGYITWPEGKVINKRDGPYLVQN